MSELIEAGCTRMRLPFWRVAYAVPRPVGPWCDIYDVKAGIDTGEPMAVMIANCDSDDRWEPIET
jgi:hypothetical protein